MKTPATHENEITAASAMREIVRVCAPYRSRLAGGIGLSLLAIACAYALMAGAGVRVAGFVTGAVIASALLLRVAGLGRIVLRYVERLYAHDAMFRALAAIRVWFFRGLAGGAAAGIGFRRSGDLLARLVGDVETLDGLYLRLVLPVAGLCVTVPVLIWAGWQSSVELAWLLAMVLLLGALVFPLLAARSVRRSSARVSSAEAALRTAALDLSSGLREARAFGSEPALIARVERSADALYVAQERQGRFLAIAGAGASLCAQVAVLAVLATLCGFLLPRGPVMAGVLALFVVLTAFESVQGLTRAGMLLGRMLHSAQRVVDIATRRDSVPQGRKIAPALGDIVFHDVSFGWDGTRRPVLEHIDLTIRAGERAALIGASGAGKSSLAALLLKVCAPNAGQITFGGEDLAEIETGSLRARIGWLSQATHLFDDTIRNNLLIGRPDASDDELWKALDEAEIGAFVRSLPDGLDSWIGEGGTGVSGGQGRRIALARTLLVPTPILILDEPANGLDADTERAFLMTLNRITRGRTVLLIAHRLIGIEEFDRVLRLESGRLSSVPL